MPNLSILKLQAGGGTYQSSRRQVTQACREIPSLPSDSELIELAVGSAAELIPSSGFGSLSLFVHGFFQGNIYRRPVGATIEPFLKSSLNRLYFVKTSCSASYRFSLILARLAALLAMRSSLSWMVS